MGRNVRFVPQPAVSKRSNRVRKDAAGTLLLSAPAVYAYSATPPPPKNQPGERRQRVCGALPTSVR